MFFNPFQSQFNSFYSNLNKNLNELYSFSSNLQQAITTYQQGCSGLNEIIKKNTLMQDVTTILIKKFIEANQKFWSIPENCEFMSQKLFTHNNEFSKIIFESNAQMFQMYITKFLSIQNFSNPTDAKEIYKEIVNIQSTIFKKYLNQYDIFNEAIINYEKSIADKKDLNLKMTNYELLLLKFFNNQIIFSLNPNNFPLTNWKIMEQIIDSQGKILRNGAENFLNDIKKSDFNYFKISTVEESKFEIGKNIACTPGKVVYKNAIIELIEYEASSEEVFAIPMLICTAWINKYYILDLQENNSFVKWLVNNGYKVFLISWINPDEKYKNTSFDDYVKNGYLDAIKEIIKITGQPKINCIGYCLGGTTLAITASYLKEMKLDYINSCIFLTTMFDFRDSGDVKIFIDDEILDKIEKYMENKGYLDAEAMLTTFSFLKSTDMIFYFTVHNYLLGEKPTAFDILYWNSDSTRLPYKMHKTYLRELYQKNALINSDFTILEKKINLQNIDFPVYFMSAESDHIAPCESVYNSYTKINNNSKNRFILSQSGHVAAVVNPCAKNKYNYYSCDSYNSEYSEWRKNAKEQKGSWWADMHQWLLTNSLLGSKIKTHKIISTNQIENAPGSYVKKKIK